MNLIFIEVLSISLKAKIYKLILIYERNLINSLYFSIFFSYIHKNLLKKKVIWTEWLDLNCRIPLNILMNDNILLQFFEMICFY